MSTTGVYIELKEGEPKKACWELLTLAHKAGQEAAAVVFSDAPDAFMAALKEYGAKQVINIAGLEDQAYNPETWSQSLAKIIRDNRLENFLAAHSARGKDLIPRVAALLDAPMAADCISVDFQNSTATKPVYAGKAIAQIKLSGDFKLYTLRPNTVTPEKAAAGQDPAVKTEVLSKETPLAVIKEIVKSVSKKIDLTEAQIIVSGGRGIKSKDNFKIIQELAEVLGAAVGASRAAVDAEFATQDMQVGQTGKTVNPVLYIACGISGAIQHFAGMKTAKVVVAINSDPEAPIFKKADYGIVGDLFQIVPLLTQEFKKALNK
jgi:electron transfer flavoprotein alpha subunit